MFSFPKEAAMAKLAASEAATNIAHQVTTTAGNSQLHSMLKGSLCSISYTQQAKYLHEEGKILIFTRTYIYVFVVFNKGT